MTDRQSLQPRSIGELLDDNFRIYREKFRFLFVAGMCIFLPYNILYMYIAQRNGLTELYDQFRQQLALHGSSGANPPISISQANMPGLIWTYVLSLMAILFVLPLLYGMIVHMVTKYRLDGQDVNLGDASAHSFRRIGPNILTLIILFVLAFVGILLFVLVIALLAAVSQTATTLVGIFVGIAVFLAMIWLMIRLTPIMSVVFEEHRIAFGAISRTWVLSRKSFWRLFGYFILLFLIVGVLSDALAFAANAFISQMVLRTIVITVINALVSPLIYVGTANIYLDLRVRKDGLDFIQS